MSSLEAQLLAETREAFAAATGLTPEAIAVIEAARAYTNSFGEAEAVRADIDAYEVQLEAMRDRLEQLDQQTVDTRDAFLALVDEGGAVR